MFVDWANIHISKGMLLEIVQFWYDENMKLPKKHHAATVKNVMLVDIAGHELVNVDHVVVQIRKAGED